MLSVVILTAFVLVVSLSVKGLATMDVQKFTSLTSPLLSKLNININEEQVGQVAGEFVERLTKTGKKGDVDAESDTRDETDMSDEPIIGDGATVEMEEGVSYKVALMADSEDAFENLRSALEKAKSMGVSVVFFLGDLTSYGEQEKLQEGKAVLDNGGLEYYIIPGDHDLAASEPAGPENFVEVFDTRHQVVRIGEHKYVLFDNSANYTPVEESDMDWLEREVDDTDFILLAQPLYHPTSERTMGQIEGQIIGDVKAQGQELLAMIRGFGLDAVFAADHHSYSEYLDEFNPEISHYVICSLLGAELSVENIAL